MRVVVARLLGLAVNAVLFRTHPQLVVYCLETGQVGWELNTAKIIPTPVTAPSPTKLTHLQRPNITDLPTQFNSKTKKLLNISPSKLRANSYPLN